MAIDMQLIKQLLNYYVYLPSCVEEPEWVIKITLVWIMLQGEESPIAEPQPSLKKISLKFLTLQFNPY